MVPGQNHDPEGDLGEDEPDEGEEGRDEEGDEDEGAVGQGGDCAEGQYEKSPGEACHPADDAQAAFDNGSGGWGGRGGCGGGSVVLLQNGGGRWNILWLSGDGKSNQFLLPKKEITLLLLKGTQCAYISSRLN